MIAINRTKNVFSTALIARMVRPFALLIFLLLLVVAVSSTTSRINDMFHSQESLERNNAVLHEMDRMEDSLQDAREAALHYVLTPEQVDLDNFTDAVAQTWSRLSQIERMTRDDPGYPERIEQLHGYIKEELRQLSNNMRTTHTLLIFHTPEADANRNRVRAAMQKLRDDQEAVLSQRNDAARARTFEVERSFTLLIGGFTVLVAVLLLMIMKTRKDLRIAAPNGQTPMEGSLQFQPENVAAAAAGDGKSKSD